MDNPMMFLDRLKRLRPGRARRSAPSSGPSSRPIRAVVFDWGDTLMRDFPQYSGPMVDWPKVRSMPGVHAALARLPGHLTCCVATGAADSDGQQLADALARVRIRHHFRHLFTRQELAANKPDPAFYQAVCHLLDLRPHQVLMVGDSLEKDILPAKVVGLRTIWIARSKPATLPPEADAVIASMRELTRTIARITR